MIVAELANSQQWQRDRRNVEKEGRQSGGECAPAAVSPHRLSYERRFTPVTHSLYAATPRR